MRVTAEDVRLEMIDIVRMVAEPRLPSDSVKTMITRAGIRLGINATRVKKIWYGEVATIPAHEADQLRAAKQRIMRNEQAPPKYKLALVLAENIDLHDEINQMVKELRDGGSTI